MYYMQKPRMLVDRREFLRSQLKQKLREATILLTDSKDKVMMIVDARHEVEW